MAMHLGPFIFIYSGIAGTSLCTAFNFLVATLLIYSTTTLFFYLYLRSTHKVNTWSGLGLKMQASTIGPVSDTLIPIDKGKGIEVIEITTVMEKSGSSSHSPEEYSNLEHVPEIDLSLLAGEDLTGDWWKRYDPPKELIWTEEDKTRMKELEFGDWVERLEKVLQDMQNGASTEDRTPTAVTGVVEEGPIPDPANVAPEVLADVIEVIPPPPPQPAPQARRQLRVSVGSANSVGAVELESPISPISPTSPISRRSIAGSLSSSHSKKSKRSQVTMGSLIYSPYFSPLPANDNTVMSMPVSPRVEQVKRFWKRRSGESECSSCLDDHKNRKLAVLACQHKYCSICLETLIKTAIQDESLWPPHCCIQDIPLKTIKNTLIKKDLQAYNDKAKEYAVRAADRVYCPLATCSAWIPPTTTPGRLTCPKCNSGVCRTCRGAEHLAQDDCPEDFELQATLEEGERQGWRRCFQCRTMVERSDGCNHMTCKCNAEFCYICGMVWKTCACRPDEEVHRRAARDELEAAERAIREQEEAEVRAAIAAAELMIRREEEERARREAAERVAEATRLRKEELRRQKAAAKKKLMQEKWLQKVNVEYDATQKAISILHQRQWELLQERHQQEREDLETERVDYEKESVERLFREIESLKQKQTKEKEEQKARFGQDQETLSTEQANEEDEYWFELQTYLKGRPNKEGRQKVLMEKLNASQAEQMETLRQKQEKESNKLALLLKEQLANFEATAAKVREEEKRNAVTKVKNTTRHQYADLQWFEAVKTARISKLGELQEVAKEDEGAKERFFSEPTSGRAEVAA